MTTETQDVENILDDVATPEESTKPEHMTDEEWSALNEGDDANDANDDGLLENLELDDDKDTKEKPLFVANAPEDAESTLQSIQEQKSALAEMFEDGEYTVKEYQAELDRLNKQEREVEFELHTAKIASEMAQQQARNAFLNEASNFISGTMYEKSTLAFNALDAAVIELAQDPSATGLSHKQILEKAHAKVMQDPLLAMAFNQSAPNTTKQPTPIRPASYQKPKAPMTLANVPSAEMTGAAEGRFAALDSIDDPNQLDAAIARLSPQEKEAYLRGAA